jgi:hypothetical protein
LKGYAVTSGFGVAAGAVSGDAADSGHIERRPFWKRMAAAELKIDPETLRELS